MPNRSTHELAGALAASATALHLAKTPEQALANVPIATIAGQFFGRLPDLLEPALNNPRHRQFFHSVAVLMAVGIAAYKAYKWEPEATWKKVVRFLMLVGSAAYASHLILDSRTPASLPLI